MIQTKENYITNQEHNFYIQRHELIQSGKKISKQAGTIQSENNGLISMFSAFSFATTKYSDSDSSRTFVFSSCFSVKSHLKQAFLNLLCIFVVQISHLSPPFAFVTMTHAQNSHLMDMAGKRRRRMLSNRCCLATAFCSICFLMLRLQGKWFVRK